MTKIAKKIVYSVCTFLFVVCLGIGAVLGLNANKNVTVKAADGATVEFTGFGTHNNTAWSDSFDAVDLAFSGDFTAATQAITSGSITYTTPGGTAANFQYYWANINGCGTNVVELLCWKGAMTEGTVLNIQGGTVIGGQTLPELTFTLTNGVWVKEGDPTVKFTGFGSHNNTAWNESTSYQAVYLEFDGTFAVNTQAITSGSVTYTKPGATAQTFQFNWANINNCGENVVAFVYGTGTMTEGTVLKIDAGTKIGGQTLPALTFVLKNGAWTNEPTVEFTGFGSLNNDAWTNASYEAVYLEFNGTFAVNTDGITSGSVTYTKPGETAQPFGYNWANINGCGENVVAFVYDAGTMTEGTVLKVEGGTVIGGQMLPELTLYMVNGKWCTYNPTVTFAGVRADQNNAAWEQSSDFTATFLQFEGAEFNQETTAAPSTGIYYVRAGSNTTENFNFYWVTDNKNTIKLLNDNSKTEKIPNGSTLHIDGGTEFLGQVLPEITLTMAYGQWYKTVPVSAEFHSIANNHVTGTNLAKMVRIQFSGASASTNGIAASNTYALGNNLKLNGTPVNELGWLISHNATSAKINFEYASLPEFSDSVKQIKLELTETTVFGDIAIQPFTIYYNGETNLWQTEIYVNVPMADFVELKDNGAYGAPHYGIYLKFDRALRPTGDSYNYGTANQSGNLATQLTFNGATLTPFGNVNFYVNHVYTDEGADSPYLEILFVNGFQDTIKHADCLHIPEGTLFGEVALSEVTIYFNAKDSKWQTEKPAPIADGFSTVEGGFIRISSENGGLRFETHIEKATYDSLVTIYGKENIQLGTYILPEKWLTLSGRTLESYVKTQTAGTHFLDISTWNAEKNDFGFANSDKDGNITDGNTYYKYYGTISNVKIENYLENFIGVGYIRVTDKDGVEYLYLGHDGSWSRNVYEVAKAAYASETVLDSQLYGVTPYFDKVIAISTDGSEENKLVYDIDDVLKARPSYSYTEPTDYTVTVANGVITIVSTSDEAYNVMINGVKAGVIAVNGTAYADYYAVTPELFATASDAGAINFGFAEPNQELYGDLPVEGFEKIWPGEMNDGSTASNIAQVISEFDGNSARIWMQTVNFCWPNSPDAFTFEAGAIDALKKVVSDFRAQGVTNIILMASTPNYRSTENYYDPETKLWYTFWEAINLDSTVNARLKMSPNMVILPGESDYQEFLDLQKTYFTELAKELGNSVTAIEVLNEMEGASNYRYSYENGYLPAINLVAQAAMDICKAATDGVKEAGKNIKIAMPALMTVSELKENGNVVRFDSKAFLEAEYAYIMGANGTKDADDYFQIINMHPYVTLSSDTSDSNYLYYENNGLTVQTPAQMKERWLNYMNSLRAIFVKNGDAEKPVWITEFGLADYNGACKDPIDANKWKDYNDNKLLRQAQVYQAIYDAMISLPYLDTVLFFRLGDYTHDGDHNYVNCGEATYGVIDASGNLKTFGKYLYAIANGVNVFTDSNYTTLKDVSALGTINGKTVAELETNVNGIY